MNIFGVGLPEMILILAVALLVFGPKRLPEIGRTIAKTLKMLQDASKEFETELKKEADTLSSMVDEKPQPKAVTESASSTDDGSSESVPDEAESDPGGEDAAEAEDSNEAEDSTETSAATSTDESSAASDTEEVPDVESSVVEESPGADESKATEDTPETEDSESETVVAAATDEIEQDSPVETEVS